LPKIYTRHGDEGETGLLYGGRVSKADPRFEACGTVDEAVSALGLARSLVKAENLKSAIKAIQQDLFTVAAELATDPKEYSKLQKHFGTVRPAMIDHLESLIDELNQEISLARTFIIPGASAASGALDLSRSILRRAERRVVELNEQDLLGNPQVLKYINRLADLIFLMARYEDRDLPIESLASNPP
jgi:cob(I)alamin adenosyltransferase